MKLTGAQALIKSLEMEGVEVMFGLPGGCILPAYDPILDSSIRHILVRHEQGAGHMAEGYAHVTGRPGVAMVTSGPAATNLVTPLCDAYMDSIPMVAITGQVPTAAIGTDAFQECDTVGITRSVTKHNELVMDAEDIPRVIREAFHIATTGRPGPVLVDVPKDVLQASMDWWWPESLDLPGYKPTTKGHPRMIREAADSSSSPSGRSSTPAAASKARAADDRAARRAHGHPRRHDADGGAHSRRPSPVLGHAGMHGSDCGDRDAKADLLIALGSRFDDRHGQGGHVRFGRRSSMSTSTRLSRARCDVPMCRSSATAASSSRSSSATSGRCSTTALSRPTSARGRARSAAGARRSRSPTSRASRARR